MTREMELFNLKALVIIDILGELKEDISNIIRKIIQRSRNRNVDLITSIISPNKTYVRALYRNGFIPTGKKFTFISYDSIRDLVFLLIFLASSS